MSRVFGRVACVVVALVGCAHVDEFTWVDGYQEPPAAKASSYQLAPGDLVAVRVFGQEGMSTRARIRADGKVSIPFVNDVEAAGSEPLVVAARIQARLKDFIVNPVVTVSLEEAAPLEISILGEVARPGAYKLEQDAGVLNAIAAAGGLTDYAKRDRIFVLRYARKGEDAAGPLRIRLTFEALSRAQGKAARLRLRRGDVVVVE
jgi:polysaccharide export outer membrane protein